MTPESSNLRKLILVNRLSPGDVLVMSGAIQCLHEQYPNKYLVGVDTSCDAIFENNPNVVPMDKSACGVTSIEMQYPLIHQSNNRPVHFLQGYSDFLAQSLGHPLVCTVRHPFISLSENEKAWIPQVHEITRAPIKYWVINAGIKQDFTAKDWGHANYQAVVDMLHGRIQFVQVGAIEHDHKPLKNVINLIGKTDARQLIRLCFNAEGGLGPVTFNMHIFAAFEKPYVCLLGGREPLPWEYYPTQTILSSIGTLPCCRYGGCWKSRTVPLGDGSQQDASLCERPIFGEQVLPKCMAMIRPEDVVRAIEQFYTGGVLCW